MQNQFNLTPQHLPEELVWLCDILSMEQMLRIIDTAGGEVLYIPKRHTLEQPLRRDAICREFDGYNFRQLGRKYGLTERRIRAILRKNLFSFATKYAMINSLFIYANGGFHNVSESEENFFPERSHSRGVPARDLQGTGR